jgi:hypothetical protein
VHTLLAPYSSSYPFLCHLPLPTSANYTTLPPGRACSALLFSDFVEIKNIKDKRRNMMFLLVWDKDSYIGSFFVLFPCIYVLQLQLVHLFYSSSLLSRAFP